MVLAGLGVLLVLAPAGLQAAGGFHEPKRVTTHPGQDFAPTPLPDGRFLVFVSSRSGNLDLWLQRLGSGPRPPDRQLTFHSGEDNAPAISPDGKQLVFVSHRSDPKGDLYLLSLDPFTNGKPPPTGALQVEDESLRVLTDASFPESDPAWSPEGRFLYFTSQESAASPPYIYKLDLQTLQRQPVSKVEAVDPAVTADGRFLVFVARGGRTGLWAQDLKTGSLLQLTSGQWTDVSPAAGREGGRVYFSRYQDDTNLDGRIDLDDRPNLWSARFDPGGEVRLRQLTDSSTYDLQPAAADGRLFYTIDGEAGADIWNLPLEGVLPSRGRFAEDLQRVEDLCTPYGSNIHRCLLADHVLAQDFPKEPSLVRILYRRALGYRELGDFLQARRLFTDLMQTHDDPLYTRLARIEGLLIDAAQSRQEGQAAYRRRIGQVLATLEKMAGAPGSPSGALARAWLERGHLSLEIEDVEGALAAYQYVIDHFPGQRPLAAEAAFSQSRVYETLGDRAGLIKALVQVVADFRGEKIWTRRAIGKILEIHEQHPAFAKKVSSLQGLAQRHRQDLPRLAAAVQNRVGELYYQAGENLLAKEAYRTTLQNYKEVPGARNAAHFTLAEIFAEEENFEMSLAQYREVTESPGQLKEAVARARRGYIQQSIHKGRWEQRVGEGKLARKTFLKLIGFSPETVEGHRGYVQAEAALGQAAQAVRFYENRVDVPSPRHEDAYALGLAYTYLERPDLDRARQWIGRALVQNADIVFYHQTLGWVFEQMERAEPGTGYLERAMQEYETALALNDPGKDPQNEADLLLNLGNGQYALNNYYSAVHYYDRRLKTGRGFSNPRQEVLFYRRYGECAFKSGQSEKAVELYGNARQKAASLKMPGRQAELSDRLALAYQDMGKHSRAVRYFSEVLDLNRKLGNTGSMARTLRNIANNLYALHQNTKTRDAASLNRALGYYFEALENLERFGTGPGKKEKKGGGALVDVSVETGLDDDASAAAQGFDKQGEQKLIFHYVGKIAGEFGDFPLAIQYFQKKLDLIPKDLDPEKQVPLLLEKALLLNQIGHLYFRKGGLEACKTFFRESYTLSQVIKNRQGMGVNASNLGRVLILQGRTQPLAALLPDLDSTLVLLEEAAAFLDAGAATLPNPELRASLKNSLGILYHYRAYYFEEPLPVAKDPVRAVQASIARLGYSSEMVSKSLKSFEAALEAARDLPSGKRGNVTAALRLNLRLSRHLAGREIPAPKAVSAKPRFPHFTPWQLRFLDSLEMGGKPRLPLLLAAHEALLKMPFGAPRGPANLVMIEDLYHQLSTAFFDDGKWGRALFFSETGLQQALASLWGETDLAFEDSTRRELYQEMRNFAREFQVLMESDREDSTRREDTAGLREEYRAFLEEVVAVEDPGLMAMVSGRAPSMGDVRERIPADTALVKFDWTGDRVLAWTFYKDRLRGQPLSFGPDLRRRILRLSRAGESPLPEDVEVLSRGLWAPVAPEVKAASSVVLIADGPLEFVPWAALRFKGKPLIETAALSFQSSLTQFVLAEKGKNLYNTRLLAVEWPAGEFKALKPRFASAENLTGEEAVTGRFLQEFGGFGAVAVGSPVYLSGWNLEDSYLSLNRRKHRYERVFFPGWMGRRVEANFLALTHVGRRFSSQDFFSPTAPLLHGLTVMGYPGILLHSGPADPEKHSPFMGRFFSTFRQGNPAESLRRAQLEWLRREPGSVGWAAYRYYGFPGMTDAEKSAFAESRYQENVQVGAEAFRSGKWPEAINRFEKALALAGFLKESVKTSQIVKLLAQAAYNRGDYKKGVHYQKRVLALAQAAEDPEQAAEAHYFLGILYSRDEDFASAVTHLDQALAFYEEYEILDKLAESYSTLGIIEENALDYDGALKAFQASIRLNEELGEDLNRGRELRRLGRIYLLRLNDFSRAERLFEEANRLFQDLEVPEQVAETWLEMGQAAEKQSRFDEALTRYRNALTLAETAGLDLQVSKALLFQGNTHWFRGNYQNAFRFLNQALKIAEGIEHTHQQVLIENSLGLVYWTLNDSGRALTHLEKSRALAESIGADLDAASAYNNMGLVHRKDGRLEKSIELFREALRRDVKLKSKWGQGYTQRNLGISHLRLKKLDIAEKHIRSAITLSGEIGNNTNLVKAKLELGHLALQRGQCGPAVAIFQDTAELAERFQIKEVLWRAWRGQGACLEKTERRAEAIKAYQQAVRIVDSMRAAIKVEEFQNGFLTDKQEVYKELILLLLESGRVKDAFEYAERAKARSFIDLLGNQKISLKDDVSQKLYDRLVKAKQDIRRIEERLSRTEGAAAVLAVRKELVQARNRYGDLLVEAKEESPQISNFISVDSITLDRLQALLQKDVALIEYLVTPKELVTWVVTRDGIKAVRTPLQEADLETKIREFRRRMQTLAPLEELSRELYDLVFRPLEPLVAGRRTLGIVPHSHLHYLSFSSLHDGKAHLIERHPLFFSPSASVLEYTFQRQRPSGGPVRVLALGNPDLGSFNYDLPLAELEAASIRWDFPQVTVLIRERAKESWLQEHIGDFQIIHIASHGEFDPVNPLFSSLKLAKDERADGSLEVNEVFSLDIKADLVTLSACQTGLGKITGGDELVGLNRAFIYAGTHAIVSSLWRVSDITTAVLIKHFYRNYVRQNKGESLRKAQLLVKRLYPHPAYWSGFTLTGDYR